MSNFASHLKVSNEIVSDVTNVSSLIRVKFIKNTPELTCVTPPDGRIIKFWFDAGTLKSQPTLGAKAPT